VNSPSFATAVGLAQRAHALWLREVPANGNGPISRTVVKITKLFREFFPG
jgi:hypothetical protein